jgi:hypothetical protein
MSAKAAAYRVQGKNSTTYMTKTVRLKKLKKKSDRTAEKNTSNGILAKNKLPFKGSEPFR